MSNRNHAAPETRYDTLVEEGAALAAHGQPTTVHKSVIVIGAGQAGLSMGYHLQRLGINDYIILDGAWRVGTPATILSACSYNGSTVSQRFWASCTRAIRLARSVCHSPA